jgi:hypothetical protein
LADPFNSVPTAVGSILGATVGLDTVILGTPRMAGLEVGLKF